MLVNVVGAVGTAAVIWVGAKSVLAGELSVGDLLIFSSYLRHGRADQQHQQQLRLVQGAKVGVGRVYEISRWRPDVPDGPRKLQRSEVRGAFTIDRVTFGYASRKLRDLSLDVAPGEMIALVGKDGRRQDDAGQPAGALLRPDRGQGHARRHGSEDAERPPLREQFAMVLQPSIVFSTSAARQHLVRPPRGDPAGDRGRRAGGAVNAPGASSGRVDTHIGERRDAVGGRAAAGRRIARAILRWMRPC
ncbi:MAG: hypothetical protein U1E86_28765 [Burkholderiaceae bacterium]